MIGVLFRRKVIYPRYSIQRPIVHILDGDKKQPAGERAEDWGELAMADSWYFVSVRGNIRKNRQGRLRGQALG